MRCPPPSATAMPAPSFSLAVLPSTMPVPTGRPSASNAVPSTEMPVPPVRLAVLLRMTKLMPLPIANPSWDERVASLPSMTMLFESAVSTPFGL